MKDKEHERRIQWLEDHYSTFNEEFGSVKADVRWLVKTYWIVVGSSVGAFVTALFNFIK